MKVWMGTSPEAESIIPYVLYVRSFVPFLKLNRIKGPVDGDVRTSSARDAAKFTVGKKMIVSLDPALEGRVAEKSV